MSAEDNRAKSHVVNLQVDGGQLDAMFAELAFTATWNGSIVELGRLLVTGKTADVLPTLDGVLMEKYTEYWLLRVERVKELIAAAQQLGKDTSIELAASARSLGVAATVHEEETAFVASESTDWPFADGRSWPTGVVGFGAMDLGDVRGIGLSTVESRGIDAVWWAQAKTGNIPVSEIEKRTFSTRYPLELGLHYALSKLQPWVQPQSRSAK